MAHGRCPKCGAEMRQFMSERTVKGGTWYRMACPRCHYEHMQFRPRRSRPKGRD